MAQCCAEGFEHSGTPVGKVIKIGNIPTYYSRAKITSTSSTSVTSDDSYSSRVLVIATDVFGYELVNVRLVADRYAALGTFDVYIPDLHNGDSLKAETYDSILLKQTGFWNSLVGNLKFTASIPSLISWFSKHNEKVSTPIVDNFLYALKSERPLITKVGAIGYCWGGKFAILAGGKLAKQRSTTINNQTLTPSVDCVIACHPSLLTLPADIENITVPTFFGLAETDHVFSKQDVARTQSILRKKGNLTVLAYDNTTSILENNTNSNTASASSSSS